MAAKYLLGAFAFALALLAVVALEQAANEHKTSTNNVKSLPIKEAAAKDESRNGTQINLDYSISVTMVNYGSAKAKVQQRYLFPNGVEVKTFSLQKDVPRSKRSADNQKITQWVGGMVDLMPGDEKIADLTYVNHPSQVVNPNSKTFHKLSTAIMLKEGDLLGGTISSPDYPFSYPNGADLSWLIVYPDDNVVKLVMEDYSTEECCDRVIVYDGFSKSHSPLATFEGDYLYSSSNNVVYSSGPAMFIRFTSDCLTTSRGFRASYINQRRSKLPTMSCGNVQQINGNEGYIRSPNYPGTYDEYMNCTWQVQTYYNTRVEFMFDNFTIGSDDYLALYEGTLSNPGRKIIELHGNDYHAYTYYASSNEAFVVFSSGYNSYYADMFVISYTGISNNLQTTASPPMSCGYVQGTGGDSGYITSPNYPGTYDAYMNCTWAVQTYYNTRVKFILQYFYIGSDDQVSFYEGTPNYPGNQIRTIYGSYSSGYTIYASSYQAFVRFQSGYNSNSHNKFNISYDGDQNTPEVTTEMYQDQTNSTTAIYYDPPQCNDTVSSPYGSSGYLYSPGYNIPGYYPMNDYCVWYITTYSSYSAISFYPYYFSTEYGYDWVRIYNGHNTYSSNLINQISGYVDPYTTLAVTNSRYATMTFTSDYIINDRGFNIRFYGTYYSSYTTAEPVETTTSVNDACPYPYYSGSSGVIRSPNYPYAYLNNMNCTSWVNTPYSTKVRLIIQNFGLGTNDYLYIYDGYTGDYLRSMTGYYSPGFSWQAPTNYIQLVFISDPYSSSSSYVLNYEGYYDSSFGTTISPTVASICGGSTPFNNGVITSPYYPSYYANDMNCDWMVTVNSNMYVLFTVVYFQTEACCDRLAFYSGRAGNLSLVETLYGSVSRGYEILVSDNQAQVNFYTDYSVISGGFNITYQPVSTSFVPNNHATTDGYEVITQGYNGTRHLAENKVKAKNGPKTLGKDLWENDEKKPAHLRREKKKKEDEAQNTLN